LTLNVSVMGYGRGLEPPPLKVKNNTFVLKFNVKQFYATF